MTSRAESSIERLVSSITAEVSRASNPYFVALDEKTFAKDDFVETQIQFFHAVEFFSRPMAALAAKIPTPELRMEILRNVWEEHGEGDVRLTHKATHREFLKRIGNVPPEEIERRALWPEVRIFNTTLAGACVLDDYHVGAGALGIIERMFSTYSSHIGRAVVANGWLEASNMIHYDLHEVVDVRHSADFFAVLASDFEDTRAAYSVEQGLRMGAVVFDGLFRGLHASRARRVFMPDDAVDTQRTP